MWVYEEFLYSFQWPLITIFNIYSTPRLKHCKAFIKSTSNNAEKAVLYKVVES